jgi:hypothetical protein
MSLGGKIFETEKCRNDKLSLCRKATASKFTVPSFAVLLFSTVPSSTVLPDFNILQPINKKS